jgi:hypothetical protein
VIPGALALVTLNVTGPAGTVLVSSEQPSFPASLASVTFTAFGPLAALVLLDGPELLAESALEPHAVTVRAAAAARAGAASKILRDTDLVTGG